MDLSLLRKHALYAAGIHGSVCARNDVEKLTLAYSIYTWRIKIIFDYINSSFSLLPDNCQLLTNKIDSLINNI